jgi:putative transposase
VAVSLKARIVDLAHARRRFGYRRIHDLLRREGVHANHKKVYRLYREATLSERKRRRRKGVMIDRQALHVSSGPNEVWSIDFVMDALANGRRIKCLTIVDDFTRACLEIAVDHGISGGYVARVLDTICQFRGAPRAVRTDQGPEFTSRALDRWAYGRGVDLKLIAAAPSNVANICHRRKSVRGRYVRTGYSRCSGARLRAKGSFGEPLKGILIEYSYNGERVCSTAEARGSRLAVRLRGGRILMVLWGAQGRRYHGEKREVRVEWSNGSAVSLEHIKRGAWVDLEPKAVRIPADRFAVFRKMNQVTIDDAFELRQGEYLQGAMLQKGTETAVYWLRCRLRPTWASLLRGRAS